MTRLEFAFAVVRKIYRDLATPSDFAGDWYGWASNQTAHIAVGIILTAAVSLVSYSILGTFAQKSNLFAIVGAIIIATQARSLPVRFWDTIEDTVFMLLYGAGSAILLFNEVAPGSPEMRVSIEAIGPVCLIIAAHLMAGSVFRAAKEVRSG